MAHQTQPWSGWGWLTQCKFQSGMTVIGCVYILAAWIGACCRVGDEYVLDNLGWVHSVTCRVRGAKTVSRAAWHHWTDTITALSVNQLFSEEGRGRTTSASWGNSLCESCLLCTGRICRDFGWAFCRVVRLVTARTAPVEVRLICGRG